MCKFVNNTKHSRIDKCMKNFVKRMEIVFKKLDKYGDMKFKIHASCCGHFLYPMSLIVSHKEKLNSYDKKETELFSDWISGKQIFRKRNFYKKDKDGYYFIPETLIKKTRGKTKRYSINYKKVYGGLK